MSHSHIFISHTSKDDAFVKELRDKLSAHKLTVWDDARRLRGGARLVPEIGEAIETARQFIVVFSQNAIESDWVFDEIAKALTVEQARKAEGYSVIPLLLPDFKPAMLKRLAVFPDERLGIAIAAGPSGLADAMPQILAALGERAPDDLTPAITADAQPIAELILELRDGRIETRDGKTRVRATATLVYDPADEAPRTLSQRYYFSAPLGPIEADELRWYLEEYYRWPAGLFQERAARVEAQLPQWGEALYQAALDHKAAAEPLMQWRQGLGKLCFEKPEDSHLLTKRGTQLIDADTLAAPLRDHRIPLVFLEACQSAQAESDPTASVAARLLTEGVTSVVAMSHSVLVETARRFVTAFYRELAAGARVGKAMLAGQQALHADDFRLRIAGAGELRLQDWFVPVLYQEEHDLQLVTKLPGKAVREVAARARQFRLGDLPAPPPHTFIGRSRELLMLERMLAVASDERGQRYAVIRGRGGEGKTTLAAELARWLVRTQRYAQAAFVSLEEYRDARGVLDALGRQLLPSYSVAEYGDNLKAALQPVAQALRDRRTVIVIDNVESVLEFVVPPSGGSGLLHTLPPEGGTTNSIFALCAELLAVTEDTRMLFTSREGLPAPFDHPQCRVTLGALSPEDAVELVSHVLRTAGLDLKHDAAGNTPQEITDLVEAVNCHARALTLLAREVARRGERATRTNLHRIMADLHRQNPRDPEKSLYACAEQSLRRLSPEIREMISGVGISHGGIHYVVLAHVAGIDVKAAESLCSALVEVGLGEDAGHGHICLHPALPFCLLDQMSNVEEEQARICWAEEMQRLANHLHCQQFKDSEVSAHLTLLELPNLLYLLEWMRDKETPEKATLLACKVEQVLSELGRTRTS